jgi:hypothetical protein
VQALISIDAELAEPVHREHVFQDCLMRVQLTELPLLAEAVKSGVRSVVGVSTFIEHCALVGAEATLNLTRPDGFRLLHCVKPPVAAGADDSEA